MQIKDEYENLMKSVRYSKSNKSEISNWRSKTASLNQQMMHNALDIQTRGLDMLKRLQNIELR